MIKKMKVFYFDEDHGRQGIGSPFLVGVSEDNQAYSATTAIQAQAGLGDIFTTIMERNSHFENVFLERLLEGRTVESLQIQDYGDFGGGNFGVCMGEYNMAFKVEDGMSTVGSELTRSQQLAMAVLDKNVEDAQLLIELGADVSWDRCWALRQAVSGGDKPMVEMLIREGSPVQEIADHLLWLAADRNFTELLEYFLDQGVGTIEGKEGALVAAARQGFNNTVQRLLQSGVSWGAGQGILLVEGVRHENLDWVRGAIQSGLMTEEWYGRALSSAACSYGGSEEIVNYVLPYVSKEQGKTSLEDAILWGNFPIVRLLVQSGFWDEKGIEKAERRPEIKVWLEDYVRMGQERIILASVTEDQSCLPRPSKGRM